MGSIEGWNRLVVGVFSQQGDGCTVIAVDDASAKLLFQDGEGARVGDDVRGAVPCQPGQADDVIGMFVGDADALQLCRGNACLLETRAEGAPRKPGVDQQFCAPAWPGFYQQRVATAPAP